MSAGRSASTHTFVQLTDTHLFADPAALLWGVSPDAGLDAVIDMLLRLASDPAFVLVTGDCSGDGSEASYQRLDEKLARFRVPAYCVPGNHDDPALMSSVWPGAVSGDGRAPKFAQALREFGWRFTLLDSAVPGVDGGELGSEQLRWLHRELSRAAGEPTIVALHHAPFELGSPWLDAIKLEDAEALLAILDRSPQVRAVLFGHVHQVFETRRGPTLYASAPSTFYQFRPRSVEFAGDTAPSGARIVRLTGDRLETSVVRL